MRKSENNISEHLIKSEDKKNIKCGKGIFKCVGIIFFCGCSMGISFYAGILYNNYLNDNSLSF